MKEKVKAHVAVYGRVQGVFFRAETQRQASLHGVSGWVRNNPDGSVEAVVEGARSDVIAVVNWCKKGPPAARVERIDVAWREYEGTGDAFVVR